MDKLKELTDTRIRNLSSVELEFSIDQLKDYPEHQQDLLDAIRKSVTYSDVGKSLMNYLYKVNRDDIELEMVE